MNADTTAETKPLIFISHKHADAEVARVLGNWIDDVTGGHADIHLSSDSGREAPEIGADIDSELARYLYRAGIVILVYTSDDHDWSYCTWECGVALNPQERNTRIFCLQCLADTPPILNGTKRVVAGDEESIIEFARQFGEPNFYPNRDTPLSGQNEVRLVEKGAELHHGLIAALPDEPLESWSAWPYMRLEVPLADINDLREADDQVERCHEILRESALVQETSRSTPGFFGKQDIGAGIRFGELLDSWCRREPKASDDWLYTLAQQIVDGSARDAPRIREWARFRPTSSSSEYVVAVGRVKRRPASVQFDCYFYRLVDVESIKSHMNRLRNMFYKDIDELDADRITLRDLVDEMVANRRTRLPILQGTIPKYIVHGSTIDRFIREQAFDGANVDELTLADLLAGSFLDEAYATSFICVDDETTVEEASTLLSKEPHAQDIFVTETGDASGGVVGWLADRDLIVPDLD